MASHLSKLPFLNSFNPGYRRYITISKAQTFLGFNFHTRLNNIYVNLLESLQRKNYRYISSNVEESLASRLFSEMREIEEGRFKLRIHQPKAKITTNSKLKKLSKYSPFRERIWRNGVTKIGIECLVYFGQEFTREAPLQIQNSPQLKMIRVGQFRHLLWDRNATILENIKNCYQQQTFEFRVRFSSKMHLELLNIDQVSKDELKEDQEVMSQIVMRTGSEKFDWIIVQINGMRGTQ